MRIADCGLRNKNRISFSLLIRNPQSAFRNRPGFTLLEVMISLAILAVLFTLVYGSFNATYRASEQLEKEADAYRLARLGFFYLARDLSMIYQAKPVSTSLGQGTVPATITNTSLFKGEDRTRTIDGTDYPDDSIRFTSVSHGRTIRDAAESDWAVIGYHLEEGLLIHEEALSNERVIRNEVGENVLGINFRYLDSADRTWVTEWDSDVKKSLPLAVEIELILKGPTREGRRFKTTVEIPLGGRLP